MSDTTIISWNDYVRLKAKLAEIMNRPESVQKLYDIIMRYFPDNEVIP